MRWEDWPSWLQLANRPEDMSSQGWLRILREIDGDVIVTVHGQTAFAGEYQTVSVQFCTGGGGGKSPYTHAALKLAQMAMILDQSSHAPSERLLQSIREVELQLRSAVEKCHGSLSLSSGCSAGRAGI